MWPPGLHVGAVIEVIGGKGYMGSVLLQAVVRETLQFSPDIPKWDLTLTACNLSVEDWISSLIFTETGSAGCEEQELSNIEKT